MLLAVVLSGLTCLIPAAPAGATVDPATSDVTIAAGSSTTINKTVTLPAAPTKLDLYMVMDATGSFGGFQSAVESLAPQLYSTLSAESDLHVGFGVFNDFEIDGGNAPYWAYARLQDMTTDATAWENAITNAEVGGGGDTPEAWFEALYQTATGAGRDTSGTASGGVDSLAPGQNPTFRSDALKVVVLATDAPSHPVDGDTAYPGATEDQAVAALNAAGIKVVTLQAGDDPDATTDLQAVASATGGDYESVSTDPADISSAIVKGLASVTETITPTPDAGCPVKLSYAPTTLSLSSGGTGTMVETVSVPTGTAPGTYTCTVTFGDAGAQTLKVTVPGSSSTTAPPAKAVETTPAFTG